MRRTMLAVIGGLTAVAVTGCPAPPGPDWSDLDVEPLSRNVALWDGQQWLGMGQGFDSIVVALAESPDGTLYAGGTFVRSGERVCRGVAVWNSTTGAWEPLGQGVNGSARAFGFDGSLVLVGGNFNVAYNSDGTAVPSKGLALWDGSRWQEISLEHFEVMHDIEITHGAAYVAGSSRLYRVDLSERLGVAIAELPAGAGGLAVHGDTLFVGGWFEGSAPGYPTGVLVHDLRDGSWRGSDYVARTRGSARVNDLVVHGSVLYIGGRFSITSPNPDVPPVNAITAIDLRTGLRRTLPGLVDDVFALAAQGGGVYAAGPFWKTDAGWEMIGAARLDTSSRQWQPLGRGLAGMTHAVARYRDGVVYGGSIGGRVK